MPIISDHVERRFLIKVDDVNNNNNNNSGTINNINNNIKVEDDIDYNF